MAERKGWLDLPIVRRKHLRRISNREVLQSTDNARKFITTRKIDSFESLAKYPEMRERLQNLLEQGEKKTPKQWKAEGWIKKFNVNFIVNTNIFLYN